MSDQHPAGKPADRTQPTETSASAPPASAINAGSAGSVDAHRLFVARIDVRWRDLDAFNHVNNSSYLTYLEEARLQWLRVVPGPWLDEQSMPVLAASALNYRLPIEWPSQLAVELYATRVGNTSLTLAHRIVDADDRSRLHSDGHVVLVWMHPATGKPVPLPQAIRQAAGSIDPALA